VPDRADRVHAQQLDVVVVLEVLEALLPRDVRLAKGGTVILTENDSNDRKITVYIPKEWQPMTANDSVEWQRRPWRCAP
jgi:hypothetical protein